MVLHGVGGHFTRERRKINKAKPDLNGCTTEKEPWDPGQKGSS